MYFAFEDYVIARLGFCATRAFGRFLYVMCNVVFSEVSVSRSRLYHQAQCVSVERA